MVQLLTDIRNSLGRHRLTWTLTGFLGMWFTTYLWFWRSGAVSPYLTQYSDSYPYRSTNNFTKNADNLLIEMDSQSKTVKFSDPKEKCLVKIMTWNLQGLMQDKLTDRTAAVVSIIKNEAPDAVFFQELIPSSYEQICQSLEDTYSPVSGMRTVYSGYFVGILYKKRRFKMKAHEIRPFSNSVMDRALLIVKLIDMEKPKLELALMTSHLESLPAFKNARAEQLNQCFSLCTSLHGKYNVVFGGDLNLETGEEGLVPEGVKDVWEECGSPEALKYTWDMRKNRNERVPGVSIKDQPKARYDRLYFRSSTPKSLDLKSIQILGQEQVDGTLYSPSDHYALMSTFELTETASRNRSVCTSI